MRLDPALEKPRRNRQMNAFRLHAFEIHPREPARIDVFSDACTQPTLHAWPAILFHIWHFPTTFLKGVILWIGENRRARLPRSVTSSGASSSAIDQPFGKTPHGKSRVGREKRPRGQRVLDGLSGARAGGRLLAGSEAFNTVSFEDEIWSTAAMIP
jgi:hypothetical protein